MVSYSLRKANMLLGGALKAWREAKSCGPLSWLLISLAILAVGQSEAVACVEEPLYAIIQYRLTPSGTWTNASPAGLNVCVGTIVYFRAADHHDPNYPADGYDLDKPTDPLCQMMQMMDVAVYHWDFNYDSQSYTSGIEVDNTFDTTGTYTVRLDVDDVDGETYPTCLHDDDPVHAQLTVRVVKPDLNTDSNNDGSITSADDPTNDPTFEETAPGKMIASDGSSRAEVALAPIPSNGVAGCVTVLECSSGANCISVWSAETGGSQMSLPATYQAGTQVPSSVWVQGDAFGTANLDLSFKKATTGDVMCYDRVMFTIMESYSYSYNDDDRTRTVTNPNGTRTIYTYDERYRLTEVKHVYWPSNVMFAQVDYTLDPVGNRTGIKYDDTSGHTNTFGYDEINRLTSATYYSGYPFSTTTFGYDWVGNRTSVNSTSYTYDNADRLIGPGTWSYSGAGSLLSDGSKTYTYDGRELLSTVQY